MENKILEEYTNQGIISINSLYDFILNNNYATIEEETYNLETSNEVAEFMALFLENKGYKVVRLFFQTSANVRKYHFAVAFCINDKWHYYELLIPQLKGKYTFDNFATLTNFIYSNLCNIYSKGTLKIVQNPNTLDINKAISKAASGEEILASSELLLPKNYREQEQKEEIEPRKSSLRTSIRYKYALIIVSFAGTLAILVGLLYLLYTLNK